MLIEKMVEGAIIPGLGSRTLNNNNNKDHINNSNNSININNNVEESENDNENDNDVSKFKQLNGHLLNNEQISNEEKNTDKDKILINGIGNEDEPLDQDFISSEEDEDGNEEGEEIMKAETGAFYFIFMAFHVTYFFSKSQQIYGIISTLSPASCDL